MIPPVERDDDLFWLRDDSRSNVEVLEHLRAENAHTEKHMEHVKPLSEALYREIVDSIKESDDDVRFRWGSDYEYFVRTVEKKAYPIILRRRTRRTDSGKAHEDTVVLDVNEVARDLPYCSIGAFKPSPCHSVLAYSVDPSGYETYQTRFVDLETGKTLSDVLKNTSGAVSWGARTSPPERGTSDPDAARIRRTVYYSTQDPAHRTDKVWCHVLGTDQSEDVLLFHERDELFSVGFGRSADGNYVLIESESQETNEVWIVDISHSSRSERAARAETTATLMVPRRRGHRYYPEHRDGRWFVLSNRDGKINFDLYVTPVARQDGDEAHGTIEEIPLIHRDRDRDHWEERNWDLISLSSSEAGTDRDGASKKTLGFPWLENRTLESLSAFKDFLVLEGREDGFSQIWILRIDSNGDVVTAKRAEWPSQNCCAYTATASPALSCVGANQIFETDQLYVSYASMTSPRTVYLYDMRTHAKEVAKVTPVLGGFDASKYATARLEITARDGTKVPVSLAWRRDVVSKSSEFPSSNDRASTSFPSASPLLLTGYGSYGVSCDPNFSREDVSLMNRGVTVAIAHVRGGGEMGRWWYEEQGKYLTKKNTFFDFVDVARGLIDKGLTSPDRFAISGRSAGGLLVGASINLAPDLFKCAVAAVPFVDVMVSMCDASVPLTVGEWEEWGNPNEMKYFPYMLSYGPMENIEKGPKPDVLITSGLHDPRVAYWEGAKYAVRLRDSVTNGARVLLKTDLEAGHFSASDRYAYFKEKAYEHAFVLESLGLSGAHPKWAPRNTA